MVFLLRINRMAPIEFIQQTQINERKEIKGKRKEIRVFIRKKSMFICLLRWLAGVLFGSKLIKFPLFSQFLNTNHFEITLNLNSIFIVYFFEMK
jgi:hypothetical protein